MSHYIPDQLAWLGRVLPEPPGVRVLDAGCGEGGLARALIDQGYEVVAIDPDGEAVERARVGGVDALQADVREFRAAEPFDAVLFSLSLHHVHSLGAVLENVAASLRPGGLLVADEFGWERVDRTAAAWFFDTAALLRACGLLDRELPSEPADPLDRWRVQHDHHHNGAAMIAALRASFEDVSVERVPYLGTFLGRLVDGDAGAVAAELRRIERDRVADGLLAEIGIRLVARGPRTAGV